MVSKIIIIVIYLLLLIPASYASDNLHVSDGKIIVGDNKATDSSYIIEGHFIYNNQISITDSIYNLRKNTNFTNNIKITTTFPEIDTVSIDSLSFNFKSSGITSPLTASLHYRQSGQYIYDSIIVKQSDSIWNFSIPEDAFTIRGLEYYIELKSPTKSIQQGNDKNPLRFITNFPYEMGKADIEIIPNKYSLIGFPVTASPNKAQDFFIDDFGEYDPSRWRLGHYDNNSKKYVEYPNTPPITPGLGLWIISDKKKEFGAAGYSVMPNRIIEDNSYYEIALDSGWNQVANPFAFDIDWDQILFEATDMTPDTYPLVEPVGYLFNGNNFFPASVVPAWRGLFIFSNKNNITMLFPLEDINNSYQSQKTNRRNNNGIIQIELITKNYSDSENFIGISNKANDGIDFMDRHQPPSPTGLPSLFFINNGEQLSKDIRKSDNDLYKFELRINTFHNSYLKFTGINQFEYDNLIMLIKFDNQIVHLSNDTTISINKNLDKGIIYIGQKDKIEQKLLTVPHEFNLSQNYPNPFNNSTSINFSLSYKSDVKIEIFNSLGRKVKTLFNSECDAGTHNIIWDGTNSQNKKVATGIYFTKMRTTQYEKNIKMLLIK